MKKAAGHEVLELNGLECRVTDRALFSGVDLRLRAGESLSVTGASGSGKSTLLMCILGLTRPSSGCVRVAGEDVGKMSRGALARHRRNHVGMVFQFGELLPELSPVENVALAGLLGGMHRSRAYARAGDLLDELGVPAKSNRATSTLSGGERQRAAVARALINEPDLLLADEPTGSLDQSNRDAVADLLFGLPSTQGCALLLVTHDQAVAERAERQVALTGGTLCPVKNAGTSV